MNLYTAVEPQSPQRSINKIRVHRVFLSNLLGDDPVLSVANAFFRMKKVFYAFFCSAAIVLAASAVYAETLKIAVFDTQRILAESKVVKQYRQKLMETTDAKRKMFADKQEAMRQTAEKLRTEGGKMAFYERKNLEEKLALEDKELRRLREDLDYEIQKMDKDLTQQALLDIEKIIREIVRKEDFTVIFERSSAGIVHFKESVDLTPRIINLYDKQ